MNGEQSLRLLIAELDRAARREVVAAASEGRFDELPSLVSLAKEVAAMATRWGATHANEPAEASSSGIVAVLATQVDANTKAVQKGAAKVKKSEYPKFLREKQDLVKLGWSPRETGPYEHRAPKAVVDIVAAAVGSRGRSGHRFAMEEILKTLVGTKNADPIPSYQVYAVLSWLKWAGMVIQHGRQGYTVVRPQTFAHSLQAAWQSLPQR